MKAEHSHKKARPFKEAMMWTIHYFGSDQMTTRLSRLHLTMRIWWIPDIFDSLMSIIQIEVSLGYRHHYYKDARGVQDSDAPNKPCSSTPTCGARRTRILIASKVSETSTTDLFNRCLTFKP